MEKQYALDQYLKVVVSPDKQTAYLEFAKREEGFACSVEELERFLSNQKISYGLMTDAIRVFAANPEDHFFGKLLIAQGKQPVHGKDGKINLADIVTGEDAHKPLETVDGRVDYKELTRLRNVKRGQLIAERVDPLPGVPGIAVTGEEIPFLPGREARFKVGKNVVIHPEGVAMYAAIDGLVTTTEKGKLNVFPVYEVNGDVDYSVGNIDFVGTVVIRGNVLTGFRVRAAGDIRVIGGVEGAEIEAEGSVEISGGIIGYHKGFVKAAQNVKCSFIQDGNVIAGGDILVSQSIMHSQIKASVNVLCEGTKGLIVGGSVQAGKKVVARTIGNTMSTATVIEVGVLPELRDELTELRARLKQQTDSQDKTNKALTILDQLAAAGQLAPERMAMRIKLTSTKKSNEQELLETKSRMLEIERTLEDTSRARVEVKNVIYGGSKIVIGRYTKFIKDSVERMAFYYHEGDISMSSYV
ncbi:MULTISPECIES: DUF342 domain-containing protein [Paenibacillus]|uniref:DUF342 domain-containing protein n=1 Tax=Paenibacillus TaxID=44249 RepID=UPI000F9D9F40|nr:FapA family protein [Paenibacillus polymyxa]MCP3777436.1 FapA family protein [Paenibacillus sp. MZ03-122A]MCP3794314.1 FapA family protein [Paenibacillus sp. CH40]MDY7989946.1 FapA family protein [Paenibacillus polymyxa]MDY8045691.1 FapA family protein [Paenibacillus polymyxa]MDY8116693.1 FapA family protein [Paenibacillus polymyxa]